MLGGNEDGGGGRLLGRRGGAGVAVGDGLVVVMSLGELYRAR